MPEVNPTDPGCLEIGASREDADLCVILMHGLGADAHDFEDVAKMLCEAASPRRWRFVLPNAELLPVTINMGMTMPAWYDILDMSHPRDVDWATVEASQARIESLMAAEREDARIILAGFSQGAAMALHVGLRNASRTNGIALMSGYLLESEERPAPAGNGSLPIGIFHGTDDAVVPITAAETTVESLRNAGHKPSFKQYPGLPHSVSQEEIRDLFQWLSEHGVAGDE